MNTYKILVIDNDPGALNIINQVLIHSNANYEILNARSGSSALEIIKSENPDLIITDWDMPEMNGIELIKILQLNSNTNKIPIIMCSGIMLKMQDLVTALNAGAIDYLKKPIEPIELLARVNSMLRLVDTYKLLIKEREEKIALEKKLLENKIEQYNKEINSRVLLLGKYNELLKNTAALLRKMPNCTNQSLCKPHIEEIISNINVSIFNENWEDFIISFEKLHPSFFTKLLKKHPKLTKNEIKICALLKLDLTTSEIAAITQQSQRAVEMARFRLRAKMKMKKNEDIANIFNIKNL